MVATGQFNLLKKPYLIENGKDKPLKGI